MEILRRVFSNQLPQVVAAAKKRLAVPPDFGEALLSPGTAHQAVVVLPEPVVITPAPEPQPVEVKPASVPYCIHCGQALPPQMVVAQTRAQSVAVAEPVVASGPVNYDDDLRPIDWAEELRHDLPMRTPRRIQFLLTKESSEQTTARILSDQMRYRRANS